MKYVDMKFLATAGAAIAVLGLTGLLATAAAGTTATLAQLDASVIAIDGCEHCAEKGYEVSMVDSRAAPPQLAALIARGEADLVVTTSLNNGDYVAVWQSKVASGVYGQIYTHKGQSRGNEFRIHADVEEGSLPIVHLQPNGEFVARWQRRGATYKRRFDAFGMPLGAEVRLK